MKVNVCQTTFISSTHKANSIALRYNLGPINTARSLCVKDLGMLLDCKLHFHYHVDHTVALAFKILGLLSSIDTLVKLYCALVRSKLEFAPASWNSMILTDSSKIERVQWKFANLCYNRFFIEFDTSK